MKVMSGSRLLGSVLLGTLIVFAASAPMAAQQAGDAKAATAEQPTHHYVSKHSGTFAGRKISYKVVSEDTQIKNDAGELIGSIFSFSYLEDGAQASKRPVTFVFNGGPGSSSLWLHLGIGPRRLALDDANPRVNPPYGVIDNPDSPFGVSDLVFIDPVGTGFSRVMGKGTTADFHGANQDAASVAQFIERWLTKHRRWDSPKFLMGESYGTVRASLLTRALFGLNGSPLRGISINGLMLIGHDANLLPFTSEVRFHSSLTTMAATAWFHNRVDRRGRSFEQFIDEARRFADNELAAAIRAGVNIDDTSLASVAERMAGFTGLSPEYLRANKLRVSGLAFSRELLASQEKDVGLYDARFALPKVAPRSAVDLTGGAELNLADDPSLAMVAPAFVGAFQLYLANELGVTVDLPYLSLVDLYATWSNRGAPVDAGQALIDSMRRNPEMQVMFLGGWFDVIAAPVGAAEYSAATKLPRDRVTVKGYPSGHMCYLNSTVSDVGRDMSAFIRKAAGN
jgi:carboxypeptidase C (cathepsin A)